MYENKEYLQKAMRLRRATGRKLRSCYFCVRMAHGNYAKALEACTGGETSEGGRRNF